MPMSKKQVRVVDPVLSRTAQGYKPQDLISHILFPWVHIPKSGIKLIKFGKEAFLVNDNDARAPGSRILREQYGYEDEPIALLNRARAGQVPIEWVRESEGVPGIDHQFTAVNGVVRRMLLGLEKECATIAVNPANYGVNNKITLTGADQWIDDSSGPGPAVRSWREAIRSKIGIYPNVLQLTTVDFNALAEHPILMKRFQYTSSESLTTAMLERYFDIEKVVVGKSVFAETLESDFTDVWTASVLAYVAPEAERAIAAPSYGYTYVLKGHPLVEDGYYDRDYKSWIYPVELERRAYQTSMNAGFLIQGAS